MKLRLTRRATRELAEIGDYLAARSPIGAGRVEAEIRSSFRLICEHPHAGRRLQRGVRRFTLPNFPYLIFYRLTAEAIEIVAIRHAARLPEFE